MTHLRSFLWLSLASALLQVAVYLMSVYPFNRISAESFFIAVIALGTPVIISAMILAAFRRHDSPIISALVVFGALFCAMVTVISAARTSISYQALVLCGCIGLFLACAANYRFHTLSGEKVRIMPFDGAPDLVARIPGAQILTPEELENSPAEINFDVLLIDEHSYKTAEGAEFISRMHVLGIDVLSYESFLERVVGRVNIEKFELFHIVYSPSQLLYARVKRYFDLAFVLVFSPFLILISALTAAYIFVRDPGPVLFVQIRRGYGNRPFRMYKFRTMFQGTSGGTTSTGDSRIIPGCGILRKLRIDEIPQCFNILTGEMSLIGPRPVAEYVAKSSIKAEPKYAYRCVVPPGITGWAQVTSGYASDLNEEIAKLSYDLFYIKRISVDMDIVILAKTVKTVLFGVGAK
ncbi:sugar transferase [Devosia sp. YIM 151766]|uniref:sugar transferase n=1 Tax=Devosia sp. YIM 151766 TaxID=3017325 RepID=UPI00255CF65C|nr:sugar transferase [Devosia sp. YIM 151766]WIY53048.1 sugar transferase [Devosia sp. YIM 151766]